MTGAGSVRIRQSLVGFRLMSGVHRLCTGICSRLIKGLVTAALVVTLRSFPATESAKERTEPLLVGSRFHEDHR